MSGGFNQNTRKKFVKYPDIARPVGGGISTWPIPKTGFLAGIFLAIRGAVAGTLTVPNAYGFASILNRVRLSINGGIDLINISGPGYVYLLREMLDSEYFQMMAQNTGGSAVTATTFNLDMYLPVMLNPRDPVGLLVLQSEQMIANLYIDWLADASVATGATVTLTKCTPYLELFTVPDDPADWPDTIESMAIQTLEDQQVIAAAGQSDYPWPRGGMYMQMAHGVGVGAAGADNFSAFSWIANQSDYIWNNLDPTFMDLHFRRLRGRARPPGGVYVDLLADSGLGTFGNARDLYDSTQVTDGLSRFTMAAGGTNLHVRRQLLNL